MNLSCWNDLDFDDYFIFKDDHILSNENVNIIKKALVTIGTALLILGGMLIVSMTSVTLYKTYTDGKAVESALQLAKNENRQIDLYTSNKYTMTVNVNHSSSLSVAGESSSINRITVYPKNYKAERIITPSGQILMPYSLQE